MTKSRLNVWISTDTVSAVHSLALQRGLTVTKVVEELLVGAISRQDERPLDRSDLDGFNAKLKTLIDRTYYLIIATNVMLKHHPEADLKQVVADILDNKAASHAK